MVQLNNVPEGAEVWRVDGKHWYIAYMVPGTQIPMIWHIDSLEQMDRLFGAGAEYTASRDVSSGQLREMGALFHGKSSEVQNVGADAYRQMVTELQREAAISPMLRDPEVMAIAVASALEGRQVTEAAIKQTEWWRSAPQAARDWEELAAADPATARQRLDANALRVRDALVQAGYRNPPQSLVDYYSEQYTRGQISDVQLQDAIRRETDPYAIGASPFAGRYAPEGSQAVRKDGKTYLRIDGKDYELTGPGQIARYGAGAVEVGSVNVAGDLGSYFESSGEAPDATGLGGEEQVRNLVQSWLGPMFGGNWTDEMIAEWAGKFRRSPNAEEELVGILRGQFQALFPTYAGNDSARYDTVSAPWRGFIQQVWGQQADESDPLLHRIINLNDAAAASQILRREGIDRGIGQVVDSALDGAMQAFGSGVRQAVN